MSRYLSEPEAWREIAQRVDRLRSQQGYLCDQAGFLAGLFPRESKPLGCDGPARITEAMCDQMRQRIAASLDSDWSAYPEAEAIKAGDSALREYRQARVLAALWFALEAEAEPKSARPSAGGRQP